MNTLETINQIAMVHGAHPDAPITLPPVSDAPGLHRPGVVIVADSVEFLNSEPPGAPGPLVCFSTGRMSAVLERVLQRATKGSQFAAVLIPVDDMSERQALVGDLVAGIHLRYDEGG